MAWQLRVDWIRCEGYGVCGDLAPDVIDLDEWNYPLLRPVTLEGGVLHDVQRAVDCCPEHALVLEKVPEESRPRRAGVGRYVRSRGANR